MIFMPYYFFFICIMFLGIFVCVSRCRWLYIWMGLEINLLSFIPLIICGSNDIESERAIKYFLVQALGSSLILFSYFSFIVFLVGLIYRLKLYSWILICALILKIGIFPFHHWLPQVINRASWFNCFLVSVIQKIAPSFIMCFIMQGESFIVIMVLGSLGSMFGGINGIGQRQLRVILAYSSIGHLGWIACSIYFSFYVFIYYYLVYGFIRSGLILLLSLCPFKVVNLTRFNYIPLSFLIFISLSFLSLSGLPPFLGFYSKLLVVYHITYFDIGLYSAGLLIGSLINLFYYLRIFFNLYVLSLYKSLFTQATTILGPLLFLLSIILSFSYFGFGFLYLFF